LALFVSFEGGEGCGKSTQARVLYQRLLKTGIPAVFIHEPGSTLLGKEVRRLLKRPSVVEISPLAELFLVAASRAQLVAEIIRPSLKEGIVVICDRYSDSTVAYQAYGRRIDLEVVRAVNGIATGGLVPHLTILLDLPVDIGLSRKKGARKDRFENEEVSFHWRVRGGYLQMATADPQRWMVIDGALPRQEIRDMVWARVNPLLQGEGGPWAGHELP